MGCDIHLYTEYKRKNSNNWLSFGGRINPGRNYYLFGLLSRGVRSDLDQGFEAKGLPDDISYMARCDAYLYITDVDSEDSDSCTLEEAKKWAEYGNKIIYSNGEPRFVEHPDWHSRSWLSLEEFKHAIETYKIEATKEGNVRFWIDEYEAVLASCEKLSEFGHDVRIVFWFDN